MGDLISYRMPMLHKPACLFVWQRDVSISQGEGGRDDTLCPVASLQTSLTLYQRLLAHLKSQQLR